MPQPGQLVIISGPSGVGKSTIVRELVQRFPGRLRLSISATTRPPRPGEVDGREYYFLTNDEFSRRREAGEFLETVEVFGCGHWYGTLLSEVEPSLAEGQWVILEVDIAGAEWALLRFPHAITIFITPDTDAELERRLRLRGTESEAAIQRRLEVARGEMVHAQRYAHRVINYKVDEAVAEISDILKQRGLSA
jgi:guanylate kinase